MNTIEQRARELLVQALGLQPDSFTASLMLDPSIPQEGEVHTGAAIRAIIAALSAPDSAPEDLLRDAERLDWLEGFVRKAYFYGGSFDFAKSSEGERGGYRFMSRSRLGQRHATIRRAIDEARAAPPMPEDL